MTTHILSRHLLAALLLTTLAGTARADEARLLRFPATNGADIVFSYAGDLYTAPLAGGTARRLTSHNGYEAFARFSPDGSTIAFTAQYDGNTEVYIMPAEGGRPQRLTYTGCNPRDDWGDRMGPNNIVMTWTPDGQGVLFRNRISESFDGRLYCAPLSGGMAEPLPLPEGGFCCYAPDGSGRLAYNRVFREFRTWKYYRGGMADDIWLYDPKANTVSQLTDNVAQDICPMWVGNEIFFISDRDRTMNIFAYNTTTGRTDKVTHFTDYDVKFPSVGGGVIVFEKGGYLYRLDPATRKAEQIHITLQSEDSHARPTLLPVSEFLTATSLSPDGKRVAVTARGEVFDVPVKDGVTRCLTHTPAAHERAAKWAPDGSAIAYIGDATGETELYLLRNGDNQPTQLTRDNDTYIRDFEWSPKSDRIVYTDRENRIVLVDVAARQKTVLLQDSLDEPPLPVFSPDGRWLAYHRITPNQHNVVVLYDIARRKAHDVTDPLYDSNSPAFSSDGRYLLFASGRDFNPIYSSIEWNFAYRQMEGIYLMLLAADTPSPFLPTDGEKDEKEADKDEAKTAKKGAKNNVKAEEKTKTPDVRIDFDGIEQRLVKLPVATGNYGLLACDGKRVWYHGNGGTHCYDLEAQKDELIAEHAKMYPTPDMKHALWNKSNQIYVTDMPRGKTSLDNSVALTNVVAEVDYQQEWRQIFNEAWRAYRDGFYLKNMHGVDWPAIHDKYAALLPYVKNRLDLTYVIGGMIGELACGHAYVDGGDHEQPELRPIGMLGADISAPAGGGFRIDSILPAAPENSALRSPLTEPGMDIRKGQYITAVDGVPTASVTNIYALLQGKADVLTELTIADDPAGRGARKVVVKPIQDEFPLRHRAWVQHNIDYVTQRTAGRVGYIYIPDMGPEGLREFSRLYFGQLDKEALIVDDRGNGGGNISPMIIERLLRQPYRMTMYRGSTMNIPIPEATVCGPKVLLVNKYSASDGDLFPWSFKENKIGPLIGTRSWGGIIGISSSLPYMDGTDIRVPFFTNYNMRGQWIIENHGVDPDIVIDNDPIAEAAGTDQQLDRAIEEVLSLLTDRQPLPKTPAPRTFKDLGL